MSTDDEGLWDERLQCRAVALSYDFARREGRLYLPEDNCCDMSGCLRVFESIDPRVRVIFTFAGDQPDTQYRKGKTQWQAFMPRNPPRDDQEIPPTD